MYISKLTVGNYKSFFETPELVFRPSFNFITGQNSSGKTALLEALSLDFSCVPHRSAITLPREGMLPQQVSEVNFSVTLSGKELRELLLMRGATRVYLPTLELRSDFAIAHHIDSHRKLIEWFLSASSHTFTLRATKTAAGLNWSIPSLPSYGCYPTSTQPGTRGPFISFELTSDMQIRDEGSIMGDWNSDVGYSVGTRCAAYFYLFKAERFNVGRCNFGDREILLSNASNLPEVLNNLQGNPERFELFNTLVNKILPQVRRVSVLPVGQQQVEIRVWTNDQGRIDLTRPLSECGTGVGQVLAILYVAVNSPYSRVILIDEPQSFLHPGAARKLMQVLRDYPQHQYICATHSATIISSTDPETITITRLRDDRSEVEQVDPGEPANLQTCLAEVGARLSDVFGADQILWVEGRTEESCFPIILRDLAGKSLMGTVIVGLRSTGELEGGDAERVADIYSRLSRAKSLMPPAVGFIFDQEGRTQEQQKDIIRRTGPTVKFLPRRMYENYLLEAGAISRVLSSLDGEPADQYTAERVQALLDAESRRDENFRPLPVPGVGEDWRNTIHAARVLKAVFGTLAEHRIRYDKVRDGEALTKDIIASSPEQLGELSRFLLDLLPEA
jgi:predicted ATPase